MTDEFFNREAAQKKKAESAAEERIKRKELEAMHRRVFGTEEGKKVLECLVMDLTNTGGGTAEARDALFLFAKGYLSYRLGIRNMAPIVDAMLSETSWKAKESE
jgi:hypothetical protein